MIEGTCAACGTVNRIAEADLPAGATFFSCTSCKARIAVPAKAATAAKAAMAIPAIPKVPPVSPVSSAPSVIKPGPSPSAPDIADLPAPKQRLTPVPKSARPPVPTPTSGTPVVKPPATPQPAFELDADLPAPKSRPTAATPAQPTPIFELDAGVDLPAPKKKQPTAPNPIPRVPASTGSAPVVTGPSVDDLPAPKSRVGLADLPAPKAKSAAPPDLPAPKAKSAAPPDLPAPKSRSAVADLPAPKPGANNDLPTPKADLPMPRPTPKPSAVPALDLASDRPLEFPDLPAPKPGANNDLPAPKGFFDDLPQPALSHTSSRDFFDDLPEPVAAVEPRTASIDIDLGLSEPPRPSDSAIDPPTELVLDAPEMSAPISSANLAAGLAPSVTHSSEPMELEPGLADFSLDLEPGAVAGKQPTSPAPASAAAIAPAMSTLPSAPTKPPADFADLDLSPATLPPVAVARIVSPPSQTPTSAAAALRRARADAAGEGANVALDLEDEDRSRIRIASANADRRAATVKPILEAQEQDAARARKRNRRIVLGGLFALAAAGFGGSIFYRRHVAAEERAQELEAHLAAARREIHSAQVGHWARAATEGTEVLDLDDRNLDGLGLRAEALLAGVIDTGIGGEAKVAQGRKVLGGALEAGVTGPQLDAAQALAMIASHQADRAVDKLTQMVKRDPKNGFWQLYLGWALAAKGDPAAAVKAFDAAVAADPTVKVPALYARGRAKLQLVDTVGAKADFAAVLEIQKDHIGAQVGLAAARPAAEASQRESDLLAILARKDLGGGDPRAVVQAWTLAADSARDSGRLDVARDRYQKALALAKNDVAALVGLASTELADGKLDAASDQVGKALALAPDNAAAQLVAADLAVHQSRPDDALAIEQKLAARNPPLPPAQQSQLALLYGNILAAQGKDEDAIAAWTDGAKTGGDHDLTPLMAAVGKLGALAKKAADAHDDKAAAGYRDRADQLLSSLGDRAKDDPALALTLGTAYLEAGDAAKAESFLHLAVGLAETNIDARLEDARALAKLGKTDDAIAQLTRAQQLAPDRADVALELARTLEAAGRDPLAAAAYAKLLAAKDVSIQARVRAGRFLARKGDLKGGAAQGPLILAAEPENAAGHYLKGEGLLLAGDLDDARQELATAVDSDPDPQYLDAQGRAAEASVASTGDTKYQELALRAYERAIAAAPQMLNPQAGTGRVYVARQEWSKALPPLLAAAKLAPDAAGVMFDIGVTYKNLGQGPTAIKWLLTAARAKPTAETYWELGQLYQDANDGGSTAHAFGEATRLGADEEKAGAKLPWLTDAFYRLGQIEQLLHDDGAARAAYKRYIDRNPPQSAQLAEAKRLLSGELR